MFKLHLPSWRICSLDTTDLSPRTGSSKEERKRKVLRNKSMLSSLPFAILSSANGFSSCNESILPSSSKLECLGQKTA